MSNDSVVCDLTNAVEATELVASVVRLMRNVHAPLILESKPTNKCVAAAALLRCRNTAHCRYWSIMPVNITTIISYISVTSTIVVVDACMYILYVSSQPATIVATNHYHNHHHQTHRMR